MKDLCKLCKVNVVTKAGIKYSKFCSSCKSRPWIRFRKERCEFCGFIPLHPCQLDVDHVDGNRKNNNKENLMTLCANCHRLKTHMNKDYMNNH